MPIADLNSVKIHYELAGEGPRLLFCNGSGATLADAAPQLGELAASFNLLSFDYRGFDGSTGAEQPYTMADIASDIVALLDHVGWERTAVYGISFGGMVAQELTVSQPQRVSRLALLVTSAGGAGGSSYPLQKLLDLPVEERAAAAQQLPDSRWTDAWLAEHPADRALVRFEQQRQAAPKQPGFEAAARAQMQAREGHDVWDRLPNISCPSFVASGRYDQIAPPRNGEAIASRIPGAEFHIYEGGHVLLLQDPAAIGDLRAFLLG